MLTPPPVELNTLINTNSANVKLKTIEFRCDTTEEYTNWMTVMQKLLKTNNPTNSTV